MKYFLISTSILIALSCNAQKPHMTEEEQRQAINALVSYTLYVDSAYIQDAIEAGNLLISNLPSLKGQTFDTAFYINNMAHLDSVIFQGIVLTKQNNVTALLRLLEKERMNFYAHPNNIIDNEIALHELFIALYNKFYEEEHADEYYNKIIALTEFTKHHILMIQEWRGGEIHPYYSGALTNLTEVYSYVEDYEKAIANAKELCNCYEQLENKPQYIGALIILSDLYGDAGMEIQRDSCEKILDASPIYQEFLKSMQENDTTGMYQ